MLALHKIRISQSAWGLLFGFVNRVRHVRATTTLQKKDFERQKNRPSPRLGRPGLATVLGKTGKTDLYQYPSAPYRSTDHHDFSHLNAKVCFKTVGDDRAEKGRNYTGRGVP
jgi:hypothetical protein